MSRPGYGFTTAQGRPVGLPPVLQRPAVPIRAKTGIRSWIMLFVVRPSWLWRRELTGLGVLGGVAVGCLLVLGWWACALAPTAIVTATFAVPHTRRRVIGVWRRGRLRRAWDAGCRFAGLTTHNDRIPRILADRPVPAGDRLLVRVPKGATVADLEGQAERVAACMRVREIRVARHADRAHLARVDVICRDPFHTAGGLGAALEWPYVRADQVRLWEPFPVAIDDVGETVTLNLFGKNVLFGGEPGAGKSAALSLCLAAAALDPWVHIWGLDAKRLELALWRPVTERLVYNSIDDAIDTVRELISIMDDRYEALEEAGRRLLTPDMGDLYVVPIDELRFYTAHPDRKARGVFNDLIIDLAARGRAAGIIALPATQKPSTDVVPSSLRDLLAYRWAMRCTTRDASDTILGAGWATNGYSAADIDTQTRGVGYLLAEGGRPRLCKSFYLSDTDITAIAARGNALRHAHGTTA